MVYIKMLVRKLYMRKDRIVFTLPSNISPPGRLHVYRKRIPDGHTLIIFSPREGLDKVFSGLEYDGWTRGIINRTETTFTFIYEIPENTVLNAGLIAGQQVLIVDMYVMDIRVFIMVPDEDIIKKILLAFIIKT